MLMIDPSCHASHILIEHLNFPTGRAVHRGLHRHSSLQSGHIFILAYSPFLFVSVWALSSVIPYSPPQEGLPELTLQTPDGEPAGTVVVDSKKVTFSGLGDPVHCARWPVFILSGPAIPWSDWVAMTNTSGGAPPSSDACKTQKAVQVPFTATYTYWSC